MLQKDTTAELREEVNVVRRRAETLEAQLIESTSEKNRVAADLLALEQRLQAEDAAREKVAAKLETQNKELEHKLQALKHMAQKALQWLQRESDKVVEAEKRVEKLKDERDKIRTVLHENETGNKALRMQREELLQHVATLMTQVEYGQDKMSKDARAAEATIDRLTRAEAALTESVESLRRDLMAAESCVMVLVEEAGETSDEDESHEKTKPVKVKHEVKVEGKYLLRQLQLPLIHRRRRTGRVSAMLAVDSTVTSYVMWNDGTSKCPAESCKHVLKKAKKIGAVEKVNLNKEACTGKSYALVQFQTSKEAARAVAKLDHHIFHSKHRAKVEGLRLIVRNLSFEATEKDREERFEVYGPLFEVHIVRMPGKCQGKKTLKRTKSQKKVLSVNHLLDAVVADAQAAVEKLNGTKLKGREMVVDFALSKTKFLEQQKEQARQTDVDNEDANSGALDDDQLVMATDDEADCQLDDSVNEEEDHEEPGSKEATEAQRGRTQCIRNLSFQTTEDELRDFFLAFGAVEYARIVYEKGSGLSKGVGVCSLENLLIWLHKVLKRGELPQVDKKTEHTRGTLSALADGGDDALTLHGRQLIVSRAGSKTDAEHLFDVNTREHRRQDKRNVDLAYEGTLNVNKLADAELELPQMDIDKRRRAIREKRDSSCRIQCSLYLPYVSLCLFHEAASTGRRAGTVDLSKKKPELFSKAPNPPIKVQMAKVLRDMESAKADEKPRSRGFGVVQFTEHLHALAALRELNNNPKYTMYAAGRSAASSAPHSSKSRLSVEFALENCGEADLRILVTSIPIGLLAIGLVEIQEAFKPVMCKGCQEHGFG
ncbi:hypothetical protein PsorP6_006720 [Peronosclerospora sorghi]|uniref:Uncharacterized protein n=1 Tax=Peronosclerospora sorghi TaxID=230839 RepID=A0ACC0W2H3_9STRA|nr:hypothetical protein PsorP6_006720 [Peronosclerospora sorghi]